ncbi:MAG: hypothetical protein K2W93_09795 [Burkholderiaceae bacterium]|nr:hypothetical protein [Burkholderiaceae bacterium]
MKFILDQLRQPSSWAGLAAIVGSLAQAIATKDPQAIGAVVAGVAAIVLQEQPKKAGE